MLLARLVIRLDAERVDCGVFTQNFVVAGGIEDGLIAVISQPLSYVEASPGGITTVLLDAQGSAARPGATITQYLWAIVHQENQTAVTNASGRVTQVRLQPGLYKVGLLVLDSQANASTAMAQKNFQVGPAPPLPPGIIPFDPDAPVPSPPPAPAQQPPVIPPSAAPLQGESGGRVSLPSIVDPNGDPVIVTWDLRQGEDVIRSGAGSVISLVAVQPGTYTILVTASDGALTATGEYQLVVRRGTAPAPPPPAPPPPAPAQLVLDLRLPSLTLTEGAGLEIDAGSTGVPFRNLTLYRYRWSLVAKASGQTVATRDGQHVTFVLDTADSLQLLLNVTDPTTGASTTGTSNLRVIPRAEEGTSLPSMTGQCLPFRSNPGSDTILSCPNLRPINADGSPNTDELTWAWRVTPTAENAQALVRLGRTPNFGRLSQGNYIVEAAVGWKGPPTPANTIHFLSSYLVVNPTNPPSAAAAPTAGGPRPAASPAPGPRPPGGSPAPRPPTG